MSRADFIADVAYASAVLFVRNRMSHADAALQATAIAEMAAEFETCLLAYEDVRAERRYLPEPGIN